jgi:hypothetical protein
MTASVVSGTISDTEPTNVVLPTPKPPATTIFTDVVAADDAVGRVVVLVALEPAKSTEHPFKQHQVWLPILISGLVHPHQPFVRQVADKDARHSEGDPQVSCDLGDRPYLPAQLDDRLNLRRPLVSGLGSEIRCGYQRFDGEVVTRPGPSLCDCVRPHQRAVDVVLASAHRVHP